MKKQYRHRQLDLIVEIVSEKDNFLHVEVIHSTLTRPRIGDQLFIKYIVVNEKYRCISLYPDYLR